MDDDDIDAALDFLGAHPVGQYLWLQDNIAEAVLERGSPFARRFNAYYRMRGIVGKHQDVFYEYFSRLRSAQELPSFGEALQEFSGRLMRATNSEKPRAEASFVSKLLATLDTRRPVLDRIVLGHFGLSLQTNKKDRLAHAVQTYTDLEAKMHAALERPKWRSIRARFNDHFAPHAVDDRITDIRALDLLIWGAGR